jgi:hypothetical protein
MKLGLQALVIALVMAVAAVPAAFAGNGHGGGKPSWAGNGKPSWAGQGKPSWAGQGHAAHSDQATKAKKPKKDKHHQQAGGTQDEGTQSSSADLDGLNPAKYCRALQGEMSQLATAFADMFGTNPNHANAFGKCVSRRAHGEDLSGAAGGDEQDGSCDTTEPPATDGTGTTGAEGDGTDTTASGDEGTSTDEDTSADEDTQDEGSGDQASDSGSCGNDDSASDEPAGDEQDQGDEEQGEDDQGQNEDGNASDEGDSSDLANALRFLRL